jgi:hypothetical protein
MRVITKERKEERKGRIEVTNRTYSWLENAGPPDGGKGLTAATEVVRLEGHTAIGKDVASVFIATNLHWGKDVNMRRGR